MLEKKLQVNPKFGFNTQGIGIGESLILNISKLNIEKVYADDINLEIKTFENSVKNVSTEIKKLVLISEIFEAHIMIANDPIFGDKVKEYIIEHKVSAAYAVKVVTDNYLKTFETIYNPHLQERKADIIDVTNQILADILNIELRSLKSIKKDTIIITNDLTPSETASLDLNYIKGLILFNSGITSHTAIIAKLNNIPLIINNTLTFNDFDDDVITIVDANHNLIYQNPNNETINLYSKYLSDQMYYQHLLEKYLDKDTLTKDSQKINLMLNINNIDDLNKLDNYNVDGIGLFRTEFLFMQGIPSLEKQVDIYKRVLSAFPKKPVTARVFDLGGDKNIKGLPNVLEENPFLGVRGIRFALKHDMIFKTQIKALLKANIYGNLNIMLPMITTLEELLNAKNLINEVENDLINTGFNVMPYKVGIMIEVPIAALNAENLAKHADFFSIGTNDLIQYMFAADRMNTNLSYLYQSLHPVLLKTINFVSKSAHNNNIDISVCGEMASDLNVIPFLIGAGINNLSMSSSSILSVRERIANFTTDETTDLLNKAIVLSTEQEVINLIK